MVESELKVKGSGRIRRVVSRNDLVTFKDQYERHNIQSSKNEFGVLNLGKIVYSSVTFTKWAVFRLIMNEGEKAPELFSGELESFIVVAEVASIIRRRVKNRAGSVA